MDLALVPSASRVCFPPLLPNCFDKQVGLGAVVQICSIDTVIVLEANSNISYAVELQTARLCLCLAEGAQSLVYVAI